MKSQRSHGAGRQGRQGRKVDSQEFIFYLYGGVYRLSCSNPLLPMFPLSFSTMKQEGSLKPTFQIPWGFLGKPFSSLDKHHPFSPFQCRSVLMTGLAAPNLQAWRGRPRNQKSWLCVLQPVTIASLCRPLTFVA